MLDQCLTKCERTSLIKENSYGWVVIIMLVLLNYGAFEWRAHPKVLGIILLVLRYIGIKVGGILIYGGIHTRIRMQMTNIARGDKS